eukprot:6924760-Pyramimonas_sp.AAC.1
MRNTTGTTLGAPPGATLSMCTSDWDREKHTGALSTIVTFSTGLLPADSATCKLTVHCITSPSMRPTGSSGSVSSS